METDRPLSQISELPFQDLEDDDIPTAEQVPVEEPPPAYQEVDKELDLCTIIGCTNDFY